MAQINFCVYLALCSLVLTDVVVPARSHFGSYSDADINYDDVELPPLNFEPAPTRRPLPFEVPKVNHSKPEGHLDDRKPESSSSSDKWANCAKAIVTCCDWNNRATCFDLRAHGCPGPFFDSPCSSEYYKAACKVVKKYSDS